GGVRTPHLDVPVYRYVAPNTAVPGTLCNQTGRQERLSDEVLNALYGNQGEYVSAFNRRLMELERQGWWPKEYSKRYARDDIKEFTHAE
ncbi:MAG TPA: alpha/beta hydrolase domain-containing protein, partial [Burkholderiales bacterium]|nr:alpha/beta hydrolase domain-containing protein [Burkholderiales bacterium]